MPPPRAEHRTASSIVLLHSARRSWRTPACPQCMRGWTHGPVRCARRPVSPHEPDGCATTPRGTNNGITSDTTGPLLGLGREPRRLRARLEAGPHDWGLDLNQRPLGPQPAKTVGDASRSVPASPVPGGERSGHIGRCTRYQSGTTGVLGEGVVLHGKQLFRVTAQPPPSPHPTLSRLIYDHRAWPRSWCSPPEALGMSSHSRRSPHGWPGAVTRSRSRLTPASRGSLR